MIIMYQFLGKKGQMYRVKFNANCPDEEKGGKTGPGSCGGNDSVSNNITDLPNGMKLVEKATKFGTEYEVYGPNGKLAGSSYSKERIDKTIKKLVKYYGVESSNVSTKQTTDVSKNNDRINTKIPPIEPKKIVEKEKNSTQTNRTDKKEEKFDPTKLSWNEAEPYYKKFLSEIPQQKIPGKDIVSYKFNNSEIKVKGTVNKAELGRMLYHIKNLPVSMFVNKPNITILRKKVRAERISEATGKNITMAGGFSGSGITFYDEVSNKTISHELAHSVDMGSIYSNSKEYANAIEKDRSVPGSDRFTSAYAKDSYAIYNNKNDKYLKFSEDFADGIGYFFADREKFENKFPNRAAYYKKVLKI